MNYTIYDYLGLFFLYAFLGWLLETTVAAVRKKHMVNRGFLNGPLCAIYGITAVFMTRYLYELQSSPVFLFLGCMIIATAAEWIAEQTRKTVRLRRVILSFKLLRTCNINAQAVRIAAA